MLSQSCKEKISRVPGADNWFANHTNAQHIVDFYAGQLTGRSDDHDMQALLANFCGYAKENNWKYEPGNKTTNPEMALGSVGQVTTDCGTLAKMLELIATHLGIRTELRHIEKKGFRCVTKPGLQSFDGKAGSADIGGRWCFGDHWVVLFNGMCYDPSFNACYPQDEHFTTVIDYWAYDYYNAVSLEVKQSKGFPSSGVFLPEGTNNWDPHGKNNIYLKFDGEYTSNYDDAKVLKHT